MMLRSLLATVLVLAPIPAVPQTPVATCSAPVAVPVTATAPNSTYYNDGDPPARFAKVPKGYVKVMFGQEAINNLCPKAPCGMVTLGCTRGDLLVLPDPFTSPNFVRITRHELGHFAGWPASHGA